MNQICYNDPSKPKVGLVLTGGGARAAYQVGALRAISDIIYRSECGNIFPIITGASAGAINATVLAAYARSPRLGIKSLQKIWSSLSVDQVFRSDFLGIMRNNGRWLRSMFSKNYHHKHRLGLLNNTPLAGLLGRQIHYENIQESINSGQLHALGITASSYYSGQSISFFQGHESIGNWARHRRSGVRATINKQHLLASSAIPLVFPATRIEHEFFGDGSVRFLTPLSPSIHLGADKILIIGVDPNNDKSENILESTSYPSTADIAGHVLDSIFIDSLEGDIERIERVNQTIKLIPKAIRDLQSNLRPLRTLTISPSEDINLMASKYFHKLPRLIQFFFSRIGICDDEGSTVLSYLLFESAYTKELISLGYTDAMKRKTDIKEFIS